MIVDLKQLKGIINLFLSEHRIIEAIIGYYLFFAGSAGLFILGRVIADVIDGEY